MNPYLFYIVIQQYKRYQTKSQKKNTNTVSNYDNYEGKEDGDKYKREKMRTHLDWEAQGKVLENL